MGFPQVRGQRSEGRTIRKCGMRNAESRNDKINNRFAI
jgi:hypothetical protein